MSVWINICVSLCRYICINMYVLLVCLLSRMYIFLVFIEFLNILLQIMI